MAARIDFCPHGREVGSHGTANRLHKSNFRRTNGKNGRTKRIVPARKARLSAQIDFEAAGSDFCLHGKV
jgi:hypothetical protein